MLRYTTVAKAADAEQIIEKSRFIAHVKSVESKEEADAFIREVKQQFKDATHNVPAFVIGEKQQLQWASDDGEPQGTSGAPIVQMLVKEGLTNLCVVVTRYFGGIKLGPGGLVRAYTSSAKLALDAAGLHQVKDCVILVFDLNYSSLGKLQNLEKDMPFRIENVEYGAALSVKISLEPEDESAIMDMLSD